MGWEPIGERREETRAEKRAEKKEKSDGVVVVFERSHRVAEKSSFMAFFWWREDGVMG